MKSLLFLPFCSLCAALVVSTPDNVKATHIAPRVGQSFTNPDNEPQYEDPVTKAKVDKAKILSGVGPKEADDRWFDWDETCTDADQRKIIFQTFEHTILMADYGASHLDNLKKGLPEPVTDDASKPNDNNRKAIFQTDPAYAQMFNGHDNRIKYVRDTFGLVSSEAQKAPGARNGQKQGALRFICDKTGAIRSGDGTKGACDGGTQAFTLGPYDPKYEPTIDIKWSFETSSSITFCPPFFDDSKFPNIADRVGLPQDQQTLDKVDNRERILLHEYTHLPWVRNLNPGANLDFIGYQNAAQVMAKSGWGQAKKTPDNYAWLTVYAYFNNDAGGCLDDAWPKGEDKPCKL
ncbi:hypothetical protein EJ05DRAFT_509995 [Pseudovirgaria hyperparasitica]|uniref:Lysine-specific metallo-endopeptidase domain-containing protein n=1 Tax=Pseudovirgaria hyperparasitica TaxID=470096 RepID=A0A6A6W9A7_9PEZI|nr:uncharacterized protein EJ05DRAFT_509995 [Pseudovirgaria hyperparasitica]KAF2759135.1 hypothetical protein EJ05DRAFT_509995 [Pseudovirgaria hyperparasitica]